MTWPAVQRVRRLCDEATTVLMIADEIATGFGTGTPETGVRDRRSCEVVARTSFLSRDPNHLTRQARMDDGRDRVARDPVFDAFYSGIAVGARRRAHAWTTFMAQPLVRPPQRIAGSLRIEPRIEQARKMQSRLETGLAACRDSARRDRRWRLRGAIGVVATRLARRTLQELRQRFVDSGRVVTTFGTASISTPPLNSPDR